MTQINSPIERTTVKFIAGLSEASQFQAWWDKYQLHNQKKFPIGLAMIGRSNVGKSTLINHLFKHGMARTSKTPGKTREINIFEFSLASEPKEKFYVYDLPGHGHAKVSHDQKRKWDELLGTFFPLVASWSLGVVIQDSRHLSEASDQAFLTFMRSIYMELILVANKIDGLKNQKEKHAFNQEFLELSRSSRWSAVFTCSQDAVGLQNVLAQYLASFCLRKLMAQRHLPGKET
jgi:GTP-binding protein